MCPPALTLGAFVVRLLATIGAMGLLVLALFCLAWAVAKHGRGDFGIARGNYGSRIRNRTEG